MAYSVDGDHQVSRGRRGMTDPKDAEEQYRERRDAIRQQLAGGGMDPGVAERWCIAWEAEAALRGVRKSDDFWDAGRTWIDGQCASRRQPPN
jgi:hypothetical protein